MTAPDTQIAIYIATAIQRRLELDVSQCFVALAPDIDPAWNGDFLVEVVPGDIQPYGGGEGAQDGGAWLLREQTFILYCFYRAQLDQYSRSTMLLTEQDSGMLDRFESLRQLFAQTMLPTVANPTDSTQYAVMEAIVWKSESRTEWEVPDLKIVRRSMTLTCRYGVALGSVPTLSASDYT